MPGPRGFGCSEVAGPATEAGLGKAASGEAGVIGHLCPRTLEGDTKDWASCPEGVTGELAEQGMGLDEDTGEAGVTRLPDVVHAGCAAPRGALSVMPVQCSGAAGVQALRLLAPRLAPHLAGVTAPRR